MKWNYQKPKGFYWVQVGGFVAELVCGNSASAEKLPVSDGQLRPLFAAVPKEHRVKCGTGITAEKHPSELTRPMIRKPD